MTGSGRRTLTDADIEVTDADIVVPLSLLKVLPARDSGIYQPEDLRDLWDRRPPSPPPPPIPVPSPPVDSNDCLKDQDDHDGDMYSWP